MRTLGFLTRLFALAPLAVASAALAAPEVGGPAPDFAFEGTGQRYVLSDYVGEDARREGVVVAWFPKAFTPG